MLGKNEITSAINKWLYDVDTQKYQVFQEKYCETAFTKHVHKSKLPFSLKIIVYTAYTKTLGWRALFILTLERFFFPGESVDVKPS